MMPIAPSVALRPALVAGLALAVLPVSRLSAQEPAEGDTVPEAPAYTVPRIEVTVTRAPREAERVPQAVSVLGVEELQAGERGVSLDEALREVPGVFAQNRRNYSFSGGVRLNIRSPWPRFGMRGIQLLVDGVPLTTADGTTQPGNIDLASAGRVEVIRGPSSSLYGNAAGGVVSFETEYPDAAPFTLEPRLQFGSHGFWKAQAKASGSSGRIGYVASASRTEVDGFREYSASELTQLNLLARILASDRTEVRGVFNLFDLPFGENSSTLDRETALTDPEAVRSIAVAQGWGESATQGQGGLTLRHAFSPLHSVRATGWGLWREIRNPIPGQVIVLSRAAGGMRSEYSGEATGGVPLRWTTGFDLSWQRDDREEFENEGVPEGGDEALAGELALAQRERVLGLGPFAELEIELTPAWRLTLGGRYDFYDFEAEDRFLSDGDDSGGRTMSELSPMVGLSFEAAPWITLYGNYATAFSTPTTVELSNRPTGEGGFNPELGPEDLRSFELGAKGWVEEARLRYDLAAYFARLDDALISFQGPTERTFFRNAGEVDRRGFEVGVTWAPAGWLEWRLAYTYQDFEYEEFATPDGDFSGNPEPGAPPHQLFVGLTHRAPFGLRSEANLRWVDAFPVDDANTAFNWSYRVVDLRFSLDRPVGSVRVQPFLGIDNLFDERYNASVITNAFGSRFYEPAPGTEVYGGLALPLGGR